MHIFIDESGNFITPPDDRFKVSCVAALVVPSTVLPMLSDDFLRLRDSWGGPPTEIKGSKLNEVQIAEFIRILSKYEVFVEICALEMHGYTKEGLEAYRQGQADRLLQHLTSDHQESLVADVHETREQLLQVSLQLFVQMYALVGVMEHAVQTALIYYARRRPSELGEFKWFADGKGDAVTWTERLWHRLAIPFIACNRGPVTLVAEGDYTAFERFAHICHELPYQLKMMGVKRETPLVVYDANLIYGEHFTYCDSRDCVGLQMVDIVASTFQRAMNGKLQPDGWAMLGRLFTHQRQQTVHMLRLEHDMPMRDTYDGYPDTKAHHAKVLRQIESMARPIV
jgi:hypothetical protein